MVIVLTLIQLHLVLQVLELTRNLDHAFAAPVDVGHNMLKLDTSG